MYLTQKFRSRGGPSSLRTRNLPGDRDVSLSDSKGFIEVRLSYPFTVRVRGLRTTTLGRDPGSGPHEEEGCPRKEFRGWERDFGGCFGVRGPEDVSRHTD